MNYVILVTKFIFIIKLLNFLFIFNLNLNIKEKDDIYDLYIFYNLILN